MFNKILIANRGEIACRIIKTAKLLGIHSVAIYSSADQQSLHVQEADSAYWVGDAAAKESYLNIEKIISVAKACQAQAIHPGYGFLSENPQFAKACIEAGIVFIGPGVEAMEAMASKQLAKQILEASNIPLTPGYHGSDQSDDLLLAKAKQIGFPVLLKAASGGGGKGMRAVFHEEEFFEALAGARRESKASFADQTMIIEKLIQNPRHIEVQIMADNHGQVVHLFERDCSIQRRHQKIIEEAPAPNLSDNLRKALGETACKVARSIDYRGAGTVEFLVENNANFYFMEMNTRLQVEHPVTELITGFDLVAWQLKIAANEPLPFRQTEIFANGHAIECRIYAEDPEQNFIPSIGKIDFLKAPTGTGIRIDSGVVQGSEISKYYDPMIAKLIAWGETRQQALDRLNQALQQFAIGGIKTNISFLLAISKHPRFVEAKFNTNFLTQEKIVMIKADQELGLLMAASFDYLRLSFPQKDALKDDCFSWQSHLRSYWFWRYIIGDLEIELKITPIDQNHCRLEMNQKTWELQAWISDEQLYLGNLEWLKKALFHNKDSFISFYTENGPLELKRFSWQELGASHIANANQLIAPMPATVVAILKSKGDEVKEGESLIVLEAMKMEHTIYAPKDGILKELYYEIGSQVNEGAELLALE